MDKKVIAGRIRHAVKKGDIEKALSIGLHEIKNGDPFYDFLLQLSNRFYRLKSEKLNIGQQNTTGFNQISADLLLGLSDWEKGNLKSYKFTHRTSKYKWTNPYLLVPIAVIFLLTLLVFFGRDRFSTQGDNSPIIKGDDSKIEYQTNLPENNRDSLK